MGTGSSENQGSVLRQTIGSLANDTAVTVETLRYYERLGLIRPIGRRGNGYREYPAESTQLVLFIKRAQSLGFTLAEVRELVRLRQLGWKGDAAKRLRSATVAKVRDIDSRIGELRELRQELATLISQCDASCEPQTAKNADDVKACEEDPDTTSPLDCALIDALDAGSGAATIRTTNSPKPDRRFKPSTRRPGRAHREKRP